LDGLGMIEILYTAKELALHIENIVLRINKTSITSFVAAYLNENNLTEAFVNYLNNYINAIPKL
jgi:hypothetical protein